MSVWAYRLGMLMHSLTLSAVLGYKCRWHFCTTVYLCLLLFTVLLLLSQLWCCPVTVSFPWQFLLSTCIVQLWWDCKEEAFSRPFCDLSLPFCIAVCFLSWFCQKDVEVLQYLHYHLLIFLHISTLLVWQRQSLSPDFVCCTVLGHVLQKLLKKHYVDPLSLSLKFVNFLVLDIKKCTTSAFTFQWPWEQLWWQGRTTLRSSMTHQFCCRSRTRVLVFFVLFFFLFLFSLPPDEALLLG